MAIVQCQAHHLQVVPGKPEYSHWLSRKINFNLDSLVSEVTEIKLLRTDTTLDLSLRPRRLPQQLQWGLLCYSAGK